MMTYFSFLEMRTLTAISYLWVSSHLISKCVLSAPSPSRQFYAVQFTHLSLTCISTCVSALCANKNLHQWNKRFAMFYTHLRNIFIHKVCRIDKKAHIRISREQNFTRSLSLYTTQKTEGFFKGVWRLSRQVSKKSSLCFFFIVY